MCGILALFDPNLSPEEIKELACRLTALLPHRGPDELGYHGGRHFGLGHARLSIMDPAGGKQPLIDEQTGSAIVVNGEIYNHQKLREATRTEREGNSEQYKFKTTSDSESVLPHFADHGEQCVARLDGMFALCIVSGDGESILAARDPCGIKPLYRGWSANGRIIFASELKCLVGQVDYAEEFPNGHYWVRTSSEGGKYVRYFEPAWMRPLLDPTAPLQLGKSSTERVRDILKMAVQKRLMSDVGFGLLLSGGLDSAIVCKLMSELTDMSKIKSFTVGMANSPDIMAARSVAAQFGTIHHEHLFTPREAFDIVPEVVYHLETYEPELIRSSIPNFFLARLAGSHVKVVLTGEGADELFAGYLYFRDCPDKEAMQLETLRIWDHLHNVNLQRSDRMSMAFGLEARVPFLDVQMLAEAYGELDPACKMHENGRMEKAALRELFAGELPHEILWRTKAMQCEGVGTDWVSMLQAMCSEVVSDEEMANATLTYQPNPPHSKEELYYRRLFESHFKGMSKFVHVWEGGCRAAGAPWKSSAYTRAGLANTEQLKHGLMENSGVETEAGTGRKIESISSSKRKGEPMPEGPPDTGAHEAKLPKVAVDEAKKTCGA